jgi:hypothetical protein
VEGTETTIQEVSRISTDNLKIPQKLKAKRFSNAKDNITQLFLMTNSANAYYSAKSKNVKEFKEQRNIPNKTQEEKPRIINFSPFSLQNGKHLNI